MYWLICALLWFPAFLVGNLIVKKARDWRALIVYIPPKELTGESEGLPSDRFRHPEATQDE